MATRKWQIIFKLALIKGQLLMMSCITGILLKQIKETVDIHIDGWVRRLRSGFEIFGPLQYDIYFSKSYVAQIFNHCWLFINLLFSILFLLFFFLSAFSDQLEITVFDLKKNIPFWLYCLLICFFYSKYSSEKSNDPKFS